jgi:pimeloyl-ACP methyl ester carboxylesterase
MLPVAATTAPGSGVSTWWSHSAGGRLGDGDGVGADERGGHLGNDSKDPLSGDGVADEGHTPVGESGDASAPGSRLADDELDETIGVAGFAVVSRPFVTIALAAHGPIFARRRSVPHGRVGSPLSIRQNCVMNRLSWSGVCGLAFVTALAGCATSAANTGGSTTSAQTTTSTATTTSSTLPASAVSIVTAPVKVARTPDGSVGYREVGAGPPLVLIMGYSGSMDAWEPSFLDALGRAHRVVIFDNAGIGRTSALPTPLTITAMANQTAALIETLHLTRPDVLGWSMGGMIAQALAVLHPSLVRRLVLCATLPGNGKATFPSAAASAALEDPAKSKGGVLGLLFPADHAVAAAVYTKQILEFPHFYLAPSVVTTAQLGALGSWLVGKEAAGKHIDRIAVPTLVADGLKDELVPTANDRELAHVIKSSSLALYPDSGHGFLFQYEGRFLLRLEAFLGD